MITVIINIFGSVGRKHWVWGGGLAPSKPSLNRRRRSPESESAALGGGGGGRRPSSLPFCPTATPLRGAHRRQGLWSHEASPSAGRSPWQNSLMLKIDYPTGKNPEKKIVLCAKRGYSLGFLASSEGPGTRREEACYGQGFPALKGTSPGNPGSGGP